MKVVILAGGYGSRIAEESHLKPKPMIEIGGKPILWHIMKGYSHYGYYDFIICAGYKQHVIKEWFSNYFLHNSDVTFDFSGGQDDVIIHALRMEPWKVTVVDTGLDTMTGGRIKRIQKYVGDETFMLTYGDGVSDVDLKALVEFHKREGKLATLTATQPGSRFGVLRLEENQVISFQEKNILDSDWINSGFMVWEPKVFEYITEDCMFETKPMENLVKDGELACYRHHGFWQCMDTMRDKERLEKLWESGKAPWVKWKA